MGRFLLKIHPALFLACSTILSISCLCQEFNFRIANDACNMQVCATDPSNETLSVSAVAAANVGMPLAVPAQVHCAWRCTTVTQCHSFNYRPSAQLCNFYNYQPHTCSIQPDCLYYQPKNSSPSSCQLSGIADRPETVCSFPFTFGGSLFYNCTTAALTPGAGSQPKCYRTNRTSTAICCSNSGSVSLYWATLFDFVARMSTMNVTIPNATLTMTSTVQSVFGWIVFQNRVSLTSSWAKSWTDYRNGFGSIDADFWLGLEAAYQLTAAGPYRLRVEVQIKSTLLWYSAEYWSFSVGSGTASKYTLHVDGYSGDAGDGLRYYADASGGNLHDGRKFTTTDQDNDNKNGENCSVNRGGGCHQNGVSALGHGNEFVRSCSCTCRVQCSA